jgi:hypothetical protein
VVRIQGKRLKVQGARLGSSKLITESANKNRHETHVVKI